MQGDGKKGGGVNKKTRKTRYEGKRREREE